MTMVIVQGFCIMYIYLSESTFHTDSTDIVHRLMIRGVARPLSSVSRVVKHKTRCSFILIISQLRKHCEIILMKARVSNVR